MWTEFVDEIFLVNIVDRFDRLVYVEKELGKHDIGFTRWSATKNEDGEKGLRDTMRLLFENCLEMGYERVCVFEDDVKILGSEFNDVMAKCCKQLPDDFDLFYMGGNVHKKPIRFSENLIRTPAIYSSHAIIYSRKAIEFILAQLIFNYKDAYDVILADTIQKRNKCYCSFPLLASQQTGYSDIKKRNVNYEVHIEKKYAEKTSGLEWL